MNHTSRSPDRGGTKRIRPTANDFLGTRRTPARDREGRSPPRRPALEYRFTSDKVGRPRDARDRSSSPGRYRGGRRSSGTWDDRERDSHTHATHFKSSAYESYQPIYNSSPKSSPARSGIATNDSDRRASVNRSTYDSSPRSPPARPGINTDGLSASDSRTSSVSAPHPNHANSKKDLAVASAVSSSQSAKQDRTNNSNVTFIVSSPHPKTKVSESTSLPQVHPSRIWIIDPKSTDDNAENPDLSMTMAGSTANPIADPKSTIDIRATTGQPATMDTPQPNAAAIEELGQVLSQLFEEATDLASLKNQQRSAKRKFDQRCKEFNQWKSRHEQFPTMEEAQRRSKDLAKKALSSIEEKCAEKDAKAKAKTRQVAERLLSGVGSNDTDKQELQSKVESLKNTTQKLVKQLHEHQSFIEKQRTERLAEREAQDTEIRKLQNELATVRNGLDEFTREMKPRVGEAHRNASKSIKDFERIESNLADLSAKLPENFDVSFRTISAKVDELYKDYQPDQNKVKEEATNKTLVDYGQRLVKIENQMHSGLGSLNTHVTSIAREHKKVSDDLDTAQTTMESLLERVTALEGQDPTATLAELRKDLNVSNQSMQGLNSRLSSLPSNVALNDFRKRLAYAESETAKVQSEMDDSKKRLEIVEKQSESLISGERLGTNTIGCDNQPRQDRHPSAPESVNGFEQLAGLEKRLADLENQALRFAVRAPENIQSSTTAPEIDYDSLKKDIVAVVESMQSGSDTAMGEVIDELSSTIGKVRKDVDSFPNTYVSMSAFTPVTARLDNISASVDMLTQNEQSNAVVLRQIDEKYDKWADGQKTLLGYMENTLYERVEAVSNGIINVEKRLGLINTKEMALYILNQMDSTYPNLRGAESTLEQHKSLLQLAESRFKAMNDAIQKLAAKIHTGDVQTSQALRKEVDDLQTQVATAKQLAKKAKDAVDVLTKQKLNDSEAVAEYFAEIHGIVSDLTEWKESKDQQVQELPAKHKAVSTPVVNRATSFSNGNSVRGRSKLDSPASRQSSGEPLSKKRRQNGLAPPAAKFNGVHGSPRRKRKRLHQNGEDDSDDVDFEPNQPTISDDDED